MQWRLLICIGLAVSGPAGQVCAQAAPPVAETASPAADSTDSTLRYSLELQGFDELDLTPSFKSVSLLHKGRSDSVDSLARLDRRLRDDRDTANRLLRSEGWYGAVIESDISLQPSGAATVLLRAIPGERYHFEPPAYDGLAPALATDVTAGAVAPAGLKPDAPARNIIILNAEQALSAWFPAHGYPFMRIGDRRVIVDHATRGVAVSWPVDAGPSAVFGTVRFASARPRMQRHLAKLPRFRPGQPYDQALVEDLRQAVVATGIFSSVSAAPERQAGSVGDPAIADILVETEPARRRTISGSAGYGTGEGPKVEASWQHRSIFGGEERLTLLGRAGTEEQSLRTDLVLNNFRKRDQTLLATVGAGHLKTDAFKGNRAIVSTSLERITNQLWQKTWVYSFGILAEYGDFRETLRSPLRDKATWTVALPATLRYDGTDDLLDPTRGVRIAGTLSPELTLTAGKQAFVRTEVSVSGYMPLRNDRRLVAAGRVRVASILNAGLFDIPVTRRLFAGGGGSVRGFGYQNVGPQDATGRPTGGRGLTEVSAEGRWRFSDVWGVVAFADMGAVETGSLPKLRDPRFGAGVGVRYFTSFGPVRADIATPINRRPGESRFGIYVSIGQAF